MRLHETATQASKGEKMLSKLLGGYEARSRMLAGKITEAASQCVDADVRLVSLQRLGACEPAVGEDRLEQLKADVARLASMERMAQAEYKELMSAYAAAQETHDQVQTELDMRHAEHALMMH